MNGMQLGDKKLIVQRASVGAKVPGAVAYICSYIMKLFLFPSFHTHRYLNFYLFFSLQTSGVFPVQVQVAGLDLQAPTNNPTTVLCLMNMISEEELVDDEEYDGKLIKRDFVTATITTSLPIAFERLDHCKAELTE